MKRLVGLCLFVAFCIWGVCLCYAGTGGSFTKACLNEEAVSGSALVLNGQADYEKVSDTVSDGECLEKAFTADGETFSCATECSGERFEKDLAQASEKYNKGVENSAGSGKSGCENMSERYVFTAETSADIMQAVLSGITDDCPDYFDADGDGIVAASDAAYMLQVVLGA